eukprot:COSAG02_NODE_26359_length_634_cov_50228.218692_1_plen_179_part_10
MENGNELLGKKYDLDEFLNAKAASNEADKKKRRERVLGAYKALKELRDEGKVASIGVSSKNIEDIEWISDHVKLDWAMFVGSITPFTHDDAAQRLLEKLGAAGVDVINSDVSHGGFLTGGSSFNYGEVQRDTHSELFDWRDNFNAICKEFSVEPAAVCVQFSFWFPEIKSVTLATRNAA